MIKWLTFPAAAGALALFGSCEQHDPDVLDRLPGHHASHGEGDHGTGHDQEHSGHSEHNGLGETSSKPHAEAPVATPQPPTAEPPPRFFND